ncbi:MAG: helix-turn-helix domain-containing protein [Candidatus Undinarchaeales archaeon]|nr:helix-turn-helix domain-containing protein [Candidatus Undinarchaeales archaeon]
MGTEMAELEINTTGKDEGISNAIVENFTYDAISKDVKITQKQFEALHTALKHKYYSWPRKITLEELAQRSDTTRRAFQENLRKAEAKLFPHIVKKFMRGE